MSVTEMQISAKRMHVLRLSPFNLKFEAFVTAIHSEFRPLRGAVGAASRPSLELLLMVSVRFGDVGVDSSVGLGWTMDAFEGKAEAVGTPRRDISGFS